MANLPEDLVLKIFANLTAKPLGRLKCLSKHWNHLISDPYFLKSIRSRQMTLLVIDSFYAMDNTDHSIAKVSSPYVNSNSKIEDIVIAGTFNGIVLLIIKYHHFDSMILYNPCTGVAKRVPDPDLPLESPSYKLSFRYGFGYGTTPDDLKIVRLGAICRSKSCDVFSLKSGSWSTPSELIIRDYAIWQDGGTFLNGVLYWIAYSFDDERVLVVALDVKEMVFSKIQLPCPSLKIADGLDTVDGHLCAFVNVDEYGLWIMHEDGSEKPWSKACMPGIDFKFNPMCILDDRTIVMLKFPNQLIIRDMLNDSYKEVYQDKTNTLKNRRNRHWERYAIKYAESFISPSDLCSTLIPLAPRGGPRILKWVLHKNSLGKLKLRRKKLR